MNADLAPIFILLVGSLGWVRCWQTFTDLVKW